MFTKTEDLKYPIIDNYNLYMRKADQLSDKHMGKATPAEEDAFFSIVSSIGGLQRAYTSLISVNAKPFQMEEALEVMIGSTFDIVQHRAKMDLCSHSEYLSLVQEVCRDMLVSMKVIENRRKYNAKEFLQDDDIV